MVEKEKSDNTAPQKKILIKKIFSLKKDLFTFPNLLTGMRILLVPFVLFLIWLNSPTTRLWGLIFYAVATTTDFFDGYFARKHGSVSITGKLLDPLADKFIVNLTLVLLVSMGELNVLPLLIILAREFYIFGIRSMAVENGLVVPAGQGGKMKTMLQMFALPFFMLNRETIEHFLGINLNPRFLGYILLWGSIYFSVMSAYIYSREVKKRVFGK